jgi:hypothetical protein
MDGSRERDRRTEVRPLDGLSRGAGQAAMRLNERPAPNPAPDAEPSEQPTA